MVTTVEKDLVIQADGDTGIVQYKLQICKLLVPDCLGTRICSGELMGIVYCIAWSFFLLQQAKTCNSWFHTSKLPSN